MQTRRTCVLRLHNPLTRENWGGRATSVAFGQILERHAGRTIVSTISAPHILGQLSDVDVKRPGHSAFESVDALAELIVESEGTGATLHEVHDAIATADELVVNGEGDFILTERLTLVRTLAMMRAAAQMGKPVYLLNSILSHAPRRPDSLALIIEEVGRTLELCEAIQYRDPVSLDLHNDLFPELDAEWLPDALFAWSRFATTSLADRQGFAPATEGLSVPVQQLLEKSTPYAVISGTSAGGVDAKSVAESIVQVSTDFAKQGLATVFAGSDGPDRKIAEKLAGSAVRTVDPKVPLTAASRLLWNSAAFLSGRYHPSILASLAGVPFVMMASNSHKTQSLYDVVPFKNRPEYEEPFFSSQDANARVAGNVAALALSKSTRRSVKRLARRNDKSVTKGYARLLG